MAGAMIEFLRISSLAVFDEVELELSDGLNCITGETGAGKSLVLNALTLLMGARAGRDLIRPGSDKCTVEALFRKGKAETVLRREVFAGGTSRCYIDGRLATLNALAEAAKPLVHIYGQHDYQDLLNPRQHMKILEHMAGLSRKCLDDAYAAYMDAAGHLEDLARRIDELSRDRAYMEHCLQELKDAGIEEGIEQALEQDLSVARRAASLVEAAKSFQDIVYEGSPSIMDLVARSRQLLARICRDDPSLGELGERMDDVAAAVEDMNDIIRRRIEFYEAEPARLEEIAGRLDAVRALKRKHRSDETGLIALMKDLEERLGILDDPSSGIETARRNVQEACERYLAKVQDFLLAREEAGRKFCGDVVEILEELGMRGCSMKVDQVGPGDICTVPDGPHAEAKPPSQLLRGEFLISTNVGANLLPLAKIASGGELSRIMLAIKSRQKVTGDAVMVFDEVDAGIGGQTAFAIASKLKSIADMSQTIVVTHLHQVASVARAHFVITKTTDGGRTSSLVRRLDGPDRVMELARMMGGDRPSRAVIEHARELVNGDRGGKASARDTRA